MAFAMPEWKWWHWIPLVGPAAYTIQLAAEGIQTLDEAIHTPMAAAIDTAATTEAAAVEEASTDIATATDTAVTGVEDAVTTAQAGLSPYSEAGAAALKRQRILLGIDGEEAQSAAFTQIAQGPEMTELLRQGDNAILQNASATGGLRGGNTQGALAQFRPQLLSNLINQQYQNLGAISGQGLTAAGQSGNYGVQGATATGNYGMQGAMTQGSLAQALAAIQAGQGLSQAQLAQQSPTWDFLSGLAGTAIGAAF